MDATRTVAQARDEYFRENGFSLDGYTSRWVVLKVGPVPVAFPNTAARQAAVPLHDLHHVATGYATTWTGEAEISAWELAAGCGRYHAARFLDWGGAAVGLLIAPRATWRAFVRGRHSRTLYDGVFSDELLALTVGDLRARLRVDRDVPPPGWRDRAAFAGLLATLGALAAVTLAVLALAAWWLLG
jgi:hypothetical protein